MEWMEKLDCYSVSTKPQLIIWEALKLGWLFRVALSWCNVAVAFIVHINC
jgi:hypothetical protein